MRPKILAKKNDGTKYTEGSAKLFLHLPEEVLVEAASYLKKQDILSWSRTCKWFARSLNASLYRHVNEREFHRMPKETLMQHGRHVRFIKFSFETAGTRRKLAQTLPAASSALTGVTALSIIFWDYHTKKPKQSWSTIIASLPHPELVVSFAVGGGRKHYPDGFLKSLAPLVNLRHLSVPNLNMDDSSLLSTFKCLESLRVTCTYHHFMYYEFERFAELKQLKRLHLDTMTVDENRLQVFRQLPSNIKELSISGCMMFKAWREKSIECSELHAKIKPMCKLDKLIICKRTDACLWGMDLSDGVWSKEGGVFEEAYDGVGEV
ncbi:hypothetical protein HDU97_003658 [Phlyctochytrium planicorne]|nr:hypothetical protein HDU97_003658 [Phlyctochytrium planicorne]